MTNRVMNNIVIGSMGFASKVITFKENEFNKELAPTNGMIEHVEINHEKYVKITYTYN